MNLLATIAQGEKDWADVLFLVAVILFAIATVWQLVDRAIQAALVSGGLTAVALALLVL